MAEKLDQTSSNLRHVSANEAGQRIDNFLFKALKGVPKSRVYKALRGGEVRVNGGRKKQTYVLKVDDIVRVPPIRVAHNESMHKRAPDNKWRDQLNTLFEDEAMLVLNKPSGLAVHGGSGLDYGVIEALRYWHNYEFLELAHRLDRETSGCLVLAKSRPALVTLNAMFRDHQSMHKRYLALVMGEHNYQRKKIRARLSKADSNERKKMQVDAEGYEALSIINTLNTSNRCSLVEVDLITGRTHQARVHLASIGSPIAGDYQYGHAAFNRTMKQLGLKRLFLHAYQMQILHPITKENIKLTASIPDALTTILDQLGVNHKNAVHSDSMQVKS